MSSIVVAVLATAAFFVAFGVCKHFWERRRNRGAHSDYDRNKSPAAVAKRLAGSLRSEKRRYQAFQARVLADHDAREDQQVGPEPAETTQVIPAAPSRKAHVA